KRRELDNRVQRHRTGVLEWIANSVANHRRCVQICPLSLQLGFDDFLRVVPRTPCIRHENSLIQTEQGDGNQIPDKEIWLQKCEAQRREEYCQKDIEHPLLRILRTDLDDPFGVAYRCLRGAFQLDIGLDELHSPVRTGTDSLRGGAREPIDNG